MNVAGLVVGLTFGVIFLLCIIGVPICIGVVICYTTNKSSHRPLRTHVVATTPATGATVVTSNQTTSMTNPNIYTQSQYPQQPQPPVLYTQPQYPQYPQQPVYNDAQLSFQEAPSSYDAVTTAANTTQQIPLVICLLINTCGWNKCPYYANTYRYVLCKWINLHWLKEECILTYSTAAECFISCSKPGLSSCWSTS